jgi:anti-anti-sigma factor
MEEVFMFSAICDTVDTAMVAAGELTELVRGQEECLLRRLTPLVRQYNVALDLSSVKRIDAAGIAALIRLYRIARESGHSFTVFHASPHVEEILALVGLDRILLSRNVNQNSHSGFRFDRPAA